MSVSVPKLAAMARRLRPHVVDLGAYILSVVRRLLDDPKIGLPPCLMDIPPPFQAQLVGTLAFALSSSFTVVLMANLRSLRRSHFERALFYKYGGLSYARLVRQLHTVKRALRQNELSRRENDKLRKAFREGFSLRLNGWDRIQVSFKVERDWIRLFGEGIRLEDKKEPLERLWKAMRSRMRKTEGFRQEWQRLDAEPITIKFDLASKWLSKGAPFYLKRFSQDWWRIFTSKFVAEVNRTLSRAPHGISLRDPEVHEAIEQRAEKKCTHHGAAHDLYADSKYLRDYRESNKVTSTALCTMQSRLRKQDRRLLRWQKEHGWPGNSLTAYLSKLLQELPSDDKSMDREWLEKLVQEFPHHDPIDIDWRLSELSVCLCRPPYGDGHYRVMLMPGRTVEEWDEHVRKWWADVDAARLSPAI